MTKFYFGVTVFKHMFVFKEKSDFFFTTKVVNIRPRLVNQQKRIESSITHTQIYMKNWYMTRGTTVEKSMNYWIPGARVTDYSPAKK